MPDRPPASVRALRAARPSVAPALAIAATFVLAFALRYPSLFEPHWYGDEGIFAAIAANLHDGHMLYSGAWDNKPPLIYFTYAAIQAVAGVGMFPLHLTATAVALATQAVVVATAVLLFGRWRAAAAGAVFALLLGTPVVEGNLAMTETFMILPTSLAVLVFVSAERRGEPSARACALIGALIGVAAAYKQVAVFDGLAIAVMMLLMHQRPYRKLLWMAAGAAVPQAALAVLFLATGAFGGYWYAVVGSLGLYARLGPPEGAFVRAAAWLPALLVVAVLVRRRDRGERVTVQSFPVLWLSFALIGVTASSFAFPHYLQQAVPALALTVVSRPSAVERDGVGRLALAVGTVLIAAVAYAQFSPTYHDRKQLQPLYYYRTFVAHQWGGTSRLQYDYRFDGSVVTARDITAAMREDAAGHTAFVWGDLPWLYAEAGLENPTRYYTSFLGDVVPGAREEILRRLAADPPVYVVLSDGAYAPFEELDAWVAHRYGLIRAQGDWRLYRLSTARGNLPVEQSPRAVARARR
ncbi:MAG: ArnT family glycosyltransferase [Dehalococcoidia bacterium]